MSKIIDLLLYTNEVLSDKDGFVQFMAWCFILFGVYTVLYLLFVFLRVIWIFIVRLYRAAFSKKTQPRKLTDEELAEQQFGRLPKGMFVFVFDIVTGQMVRQHTERFLSSRELDLTKYKQFRAMNLDQAKFKYQEFKRAWKTIKNS